MKKTTKLVALFTSALFIIGGFSSCGKLSPEEKIVGFNGKRVEHNI